MKYVIWFCNREYEPNKWECASAINFDKNIFVFEEEKFASYKYKIAMTDNINLIYQMKEYAVNKYPDYEWEVREKE